MKLPSGLVFVGLLGIGLSTYSCANGDTVSGTGSGNGGSSSSEGGSLGNGGSTGNGGSISHTGGTTGSGGTVTHTGGTTGAGGSVTHTGGTTGNGGSIATGGTTGNGGTTGAGGTSATGSGGTGSVSCSASFGVSSAGFVTMPIKAAGCWSGYGYTYADSYGTTIMPASPTPGFSACGMPCALTATGNIVAVTGTNYSYAGVAFNLGQTSSGGTTNTPVIPTGNGLTVNYSATVPAGLAVRVQITDGTNNYCATVTSSPASIPYGTFNTQCYDTPADGIAYAKTGITAIQLQVAGGTGSGAYSLTINSVTEN